MTNLDRLIEWHQNELRHINSALESDKPARSKNRWENRRRNHERTVQELLRLRWVAFVNRDADTIESLRKDAERYRFIKQWARRLDITGYSLTNNEHFEPRIDEAMAIASQPSSADVERRPCTCHPDDNPPVPCPRMYALQDCRRAAALAAEIESLRARMADMQGERDAAELSRDAAHARLAEAERTIARLSGFKP